MFEGICNRFADELNAVTSQPTFSLNPCRVDTANSHTSHAAGGSPGPSAILAAGPSQASSSEVSDPSWGFKFSVPTGWKYQKEARSVLLGHDTVPGLIAVLPHEVTSLQEVQAQMQQGLQEEGVSLRLTGMLQRFGNNGMTGDYAGVAQGEQVKARGIGTLSPHGGGAYIIAMGVPQKFGPSLTGAAEAIAKGMQYVKADGSDLIRHLPGRGLP